MDLETCLAAAGELAAAVPEGVSLPAATLAWIASQPGITSVIPGARTPEQAVGNADAAALLDGSVDLEGFDRAVHDVYERRLRARIHHRW